MKTRIKMQADKFVFFSCLAASIGLLIGGFFTPPPGEIHNSVLSATGILFGFAALASGALAIHDGRIAKITKGDIEVLIGDTADNDEN